MIVSGKNIVVTGAASGIGKHVVTLLLQQGAKVLAVDKADLLLNTHPNLFILQADISTSAAIDDLFTHAVDTLGGIDVFIANAGFAYYEKLEQPDWQRMEAIYKVNVLSPIYSLKKLVQLNGDKPCSFVAVSSAMAYLGVPGYAQYAGTKGRYTVLWRPTVTSTTTAYTLWWCTPLPLKPTSLIRQVITFPLHGLRKNHKRLPRQWLMG
ncbi:MAG: SDR family oxidoreductase [Sphingobacteriales bacterium JAD_PAG50586_3]|nr:MAG: SDR family oxidoreductase [Sphingobacteriales bacterium JAD_PAG50586_3]